MVCLAHCRQGLQQKPWKLKDLFFKTKSKTKINVQDQDQDFHFFVLEAPRDQDPDLENNMLSTEFYINRLTTFCIVSKWLRGKHNILGGGEKYTPMT